MLNIPSRITQGVTVELSGSVTDYPASDYTLTVVFVASGNQTSVEAVADGDDYTLTLSKAVTAAMAVGVHHWQAFVSDATERFKVGEGEVQVVLDYAIMSGGFDARSTLRQQVEAIRAVLAGVATDDQKKKKYADREIERFDRADLISIYKFLKQELKSEDRAAAVANGKTFGGRVRVRF